MNLSSKIWVLLGAAAIVLLLRSLKTNPAHEILKVVTPQTAVPRPRELKPHSKQDGPAVSNAESVSNSESAQLSATQIGKLEDAAKEEQRWTRERDSFLRGLKVSLVQIEQLENARQMALEEQEAIDLEDAQGKKMAQLRLTLLEKIQKEIGAEGFKEYEQFYRQYWDISPHTPLTANHLPWM